MAIIKIELECPDVGDMVISLQEIEEKIQEGIISGDGWELTGLKTDEDSHSYDE